MSVAGPAPVIPLHPPGPMAERDDDALMRLAGAGQRAAFEILASRYLVRVADYCAKFTGDPRTGEDLAQEVLLEAWSQRLRYGGRGKFAVFLFTIARNRCRNRARDTGRRGAAWQAGLEAAAGPPGPDQLDRLLQLERERRVRAAMLHLPDKLREAVLLRFDQGLGYDEIARIVTRPEVTVRSRVFHALRRLRALLEEESP